MTNRARASLHARADSVRINPQTLILPNANSRIVLPRRDAHSSVITITWNADAVAKRYGGTAIVEHRRL